MFWELYKFEFNYRRKMISTYIFLFIFFAVGFSLTNVLGGAISGARIVVMGSGERILLNSAAINSLILSNITILLIFIIAAVVAMCFGKDFEGNSYLLFYSKPISKYTYVLSKYLFAVTFLVMMKLFLIAGQVVAYYMPWIEQSYFMKPQILHYLSPLTTLLIPNIFVLCGILTAVLVLWKKSYLVYMAALVLLVGYYLSLSLMPNLNNRFLSALLDPLGLNAVFEYIRHWTIADRNSQLVPISGVILYNRLLWLGISTSILLIALGFFKMQWISRTAQTGKKKYRAFEQNFSRKIEIIVADDLKTTLYRLYLMLRYNLRLIFNNLSFYFILLICLGLAIFTITQQGKVYGVMTYPVTYQVAEAMIDISRLFIIIIIAILAGELVWESRTNRYDLILDSLPLKRWVQYLSQLIALNLTIVVILLVLILSGILFQLLSNYTNFEIPVYFKIIFGLNYLSIFLFIVVALFIHTVLSNKYVAHFVVIFLLLGQGFMGQMGIKHNLLVFGKTPAVTYSDMNSLGANLNGFIYTSLYWFLLSLLLVQITIIIYRKGLENPLRKTIHRLSSSPGKMIPLLINLILFAALAGYVYYNNNILNRYYSAKQMERAQVNYEMSYKNLEQNPQPSIIDISLEVDIYPSQRDIEYTGAYLLRNYHEQAIEELYLQIPSEITLNSLEFSKEMELIDHNRDFNFRIYSFKEPLGVGEEMSISFDCSLITRGFAHDENNFLNRNGSFINSGYFPQIGYNSNYEIYSNRIRNRYGLPAKERRAEIDDEYYVNYNYVSNNDHWLTFEAKISTERDQIALAPGDLLNSYIENDRAHFHYKLDGKMINYYALLSAEYEIVRDSWNDVEIEIYHHPTHKYNLDSMLKGVKESLEYYTANFSPYPHKIVRIVEFPRYGSFAQALPTLIPFSESIGFIARVKEKSINYPYFVTAHEMAHQWWAHQVISANVKGALLITEALSQYSALMVKRTNLGEDMVQQQLKYERDRYFSSRASEDREENPLYLDDGQAYVHYHKGAAALYGLSNYLGEEKMNRILQSFINDYAYSFKPYPTSLDLLEYFYREAPDSLHYQLDDTFKKITTYSNRVTNVTRELNGDDTYTVYLDTETEKYYYDGLGNATPAELNDWIEIVIYGEIFVSGERREIPIYREMHLLTEKENSFVVNVDRMPTKAGIDPNLYLLDLNTSSNTKIIQ